MTVKSDYSLINQQQQEQMLKLVTQSFYKELLSYGIRNGGIVRASTHLLDYMTSNGRQERPKQSFYDGLFSIDDIEVVSSSHNCLRIDDVSIETLGQEDIPQIRQWLTVPEIRQALITPLPRDDNDLVDYFLASEERRYFAILHRGRRFVGIIGAENIDQHSRKLEMKKFIGRRGLRGKGIGKRATLLFLYFAFQLMEFNKCYIHSVNTNIRNINLNSKFGFELEGISFQDILIDGSYRDVVKMGLLREQWQSIFATLND